MHDRRRQEASSHNFYFSFAKKQTQPRGLFTNEAFALFIIRAMNARVLNKIIYRRNANKIEHTGEQRDCWRRVRVIICD